MRRHCLMLKKRTNQFVGVKGLIFSLLVILQLATSPALVLAQNKLPDDFCLSLDEKNLYNAINTLLTEYDQKTVKLSASLSYVAKIHVNDLLVNKPDTSVCNLSSWSDKGEWTPCCHNPYVPQQDCMWDKPKELTSYPYRGYELVAYFEDDFNVDSVINLWSSTKAVLDMLLARGNFSAKKWVCMGVGINERYVSVWFGQRPDKVSVPDVCIDDLEKALAGATTAVAGDTGIAQITYYIVVGSYTETKDAREMVKRLKKSGYENAGTLLNKEMTRVYLNKFNNLKEAMYVKQQLPYNYREAWIYKE